jgi:hypothetical protein
MRGLKAVLCAAMLGGVLFGANAALGAGMEPGGSVHVFATPGPTGTILLTGAIGDYGKTLNINANGKVDANGHYVKVNLKHGTFEINAVALNVKLAKVNPSINKTTCSGEGSGTGSVTLLDGTGLYKGLSGTLNVTASFAVIAPRFTSGKSKGQCNLSNSAQPVDQYSWITGSGTVKFT